VGPAVVVGASSGRKGLEGEKPSPEDPGKVAAVPRPIPLPCRFQLLLVHLCWGKNSLRHSAHYPYSRLNPECLAPVGPVAAMPAALSLSVRCLQISKHSMHPALPGWSARRPTPVLRPAPVAGGPVTAPPALLAKWSRPACSPAASSRPRSGFEDPPEDV